MKKILLIVLLLLAAAAAWLYFVEPEVLDRFREPAPLPERERPSPPAEEPRPPTPTAEPDTAPPAAPSKRATATLVLPEGAREIYVNGAAAQPGARVTVPTGENLVATYQNGRYSQELVMAERGQIYELQFEEKLQETPVSWDTFQGNARRTGFVDAPDRGELKLEWRGDLKDKVRASPIVLGNTAYLSSANHLISAVDLESGKLLWSEGKLGSDVSPIANDRYIFAGDDTGRFAGYRREDGKMRGFTSLGSYPTSLALISEEAFLAVTRDNRLFSIKTRKNFRGRLPLNINWEVAVPELGAANATPLILGDTAILQAESGAPLAISLADGSRLWPKQGENSNANNQMEGDMQLAFADEDRFLTPTPASDGQTLYAVVEQTLTAFDVASGAVRWQRKLAYKPTSSVSLAYGALYIGGADGALYAHATANGARIFFRSLGDKPIFASPVIFKNKLLAAGGEGGLFLLHCFTGEILATDKTLAGSPIAGTPAVAGGRILAINQAGKMACFR